MIKTEDFIVICGLYGHWFAPRRGPKGSPAIVRRSAMVVTGFAPSLPLVAVIRWCNYLPRI